MTLDNMTQPVWGDSTDYFLDRDNKYRTTDVSVFAVDKP
jgi:hypothetical protein